MQADEATPETPAPASEPRPGIVGRAARRPLAILLGAAAAVLPWLAISWSIGTEGGLRFLAHALDVATRGQIRIEQPSGRLADSLRAERFVFAMAGVDVDARKLAIDWSPSELLSGWVHAKRVRVQSLSVTYTRSHEPSGPLNAIALPIGLRLDDVALDHFTLFQRDGAKLDRMFELREASAAADMGHELWRFSRVSGTTDWGPARLDGTLATMAPFAIDAVGNISAHYGAHPIEAKLAAHGSLTDMTLGFQASSDAMKADGELGLRLFEPMLLRSVALEGGPIDPSRFHPDAPVAALQVRVRLQPALDPHGVPEAARLAESRIEGPFEITNAAPGRIDQGRLPIERASGRLTFDASELIVKDLTLALPGAGRVAGALAWRPSPEGAPDAIGRTDARISLAGIDPAKLHKALPTARLGGELVARSEPARQRLEGKLSDGRLVADLAGDLRGERIEVERLRLTMGTMLASATGWFDLGAANNFKVDGEARDLDPAALWNQAPRGQLNGTLAANGRLSPRLAFDGQLQLTDSRLAGMPLSGGGSLSLDGSRIHHADVNLSALGNRLAVQGAFGAAGDRLTLRVDAPQLEHLGQGFSGRMSARGTLGGTLDQPAGQIDLVASQLAVPDVVRVDAVNLRGRLGEGREGEIDMRFTLGGLRSAAGAERIVHRGALTVLGKRSDHRVTLEADFPRSHALQLAAHGGLSARLDWNGMLDRFDLEWNGEASLAEPATLEVGPDHFRLGKTRLLGDRASFRLDETRWSPDEMVAKGSMTGLRLGLALNESQQVVARGNTLQMGAEWDLHLQKAVNGQIRVFREAGDLVLEGDAPVALGLTEFEAIIAANDDRLALAASAAGTRIGVISASATAQSRREGKGWRIARSLPLLGRARIEVPSVDWIGPLLDPNLRTEGSLIGDFSLSGTPDNPVATGAISGERLGVMLVEQGLRLGGGMLKARFDADRLYLDDLSFTSPSRVQPNENRIDYAGLAVRPGSATATGAVELATGEGSFRINADRLPILQRRDLWLMLSGEGQIKTGWDSMVVTGSVTVPAGFIGPTRTGAPTLDDDVVVRGRTKPQEKPFRITADVDADLGNALYLHAFGVDTRLAGAIRLRARPGEPLRASGRIETRDGQYDAYGQRLSIDKGLITFQGPLDNPTLSIEAVRKGLAVEAGVQISGSAQRPKVRLISEPNVPDAEKLSWIVLGRPPGGNSDGDAGVLVAAAGALLGDQTGGLTNQIANTFGIDQIMIAQSENRGLGHGATSQVAGSATGFSSSSASAGGGTVAGQVAMLGKRLTRDISLTYEQSLSGSESLVKLSYALTRRLSMVARAGSDNAIDLHYNISFR